MYSFKTVQSYQLVLAILMFLFYFIIIYLKVKVNQCDFH
jgi:hypothetical protein